MPTTVRKACWVLGGEAVADLKAFSRKEVAKMKATPPKISFRWVVVRDSAAGKCKTCPDATAARVW